MPTISSKLTHIHTDKHQLRLLIEGGTNLSITLPAWGWGGGWGHPRTRLTNIETDSLLLPIIAPPLGGPRTRLTNIEAG